LPLLLALFVVLALSQALCVMQWLAAAHLSPWAPVQPTDRASPCVPAAACCCCSCLAARQGGRQLLSLLSLSTQQMRQP
jgi:hypothetical protein